jgi:hypothetical protein
MAVEVIEGDLHPTEPSNGRKKFARYKDLQITIPDGKVRPLGKIFAGGGVIDEVRRGGRGRYYFAKSDGAVGLIGVRRPDGTRTYSHFTNIEPVLLVVGILGVLGGVAKFVLGVEDFPLTPVVLGPLLLLGWAYLRNQRLGFQREFEADTA